MGIRHFKPPKRQREGGRETVTRRISASRCLAIPAAIYLSSIYNFSTFQILLLQGAAYRLQERLLFFFGYRPEVQQDLFLFDPGDHGRVAFSQSLL